jgi:hypothetical protein
VLFVGVKILMIMPRKFTTTLVSWPVRFYPVT